MTGWSERKEVVNHTHCRALNTHQTVRGKGNGKVSPVKNNSLASRHVANQVRASNEYTFSNQHQTAVVS